ncbi:hypothetical protein PN419_12335 [Halorubrum ezzemoulense]|jgi:hypothetical protein|uniref:DUF8006 domain-containing protein n=2 Tax=Halorubrum ezzemoulense TaxID=337243 RepID=A0A256KQY7_HALEZ|nr:MULTISPECIES: hypothetical protein [Halorubrum]MDB2223343.1 hypothetical protein [Halorubrum ezzemoulense]MDB2237692.1 hypothetical protein [Halorubrum ezzemoulense]MDB2240714.1 hypothetical protein [Halorubrum ezzemoulense]MDB2243412.1 hypothetical protein [Halorubrum ezzemoulense]MDB2248814.1 hypothetical protein [Halorubrum ezzemoulense]
MISPLVIDTFLLDYHLGHVLLFGLVVSLLGVAPLKSQKALASIMAVFGVIFLMAPYTTMPPTFILLGIPLVLVGTLLWTMAR